MKKMLEEFHLTGETVRISTADGDKVNARVDEVPNAEDGRTAVLITDQDHRKPRWIAIDQIVALETAPPKEPDYVPVTGIVTG